MLLERTIFQLDIGHVPPEIAEELGQLGYMQWLGGLPGQADYLQEARVALERARPFADCSPALDVFCRILEASMVMPPVALPLRLPPRGRRGGAQARRMFH
ncbi:MAG: hypothetical protein AAGF79_21175 [Pseudomonadota bacterium]